LVEGGARAGTAEVLMRSRYTAFVLGREDYLLSSWHPSTRPATLDLDTEPAPKWIGLQVRDHVQLAPDRAEVEFVARYRVGGRAHRLHERSRFVREDDRWYYVDGTIY
jgi:SEC-C motif-containing protein